MDKLVKQNFEKLFRFSPYIILFTFFALFLETFRFPGFTAKYFLIDVKIIFSASVVILLFSKKDSKILKSIYKANYFILFISVISYFIFSYLEGSNYANYVLANYKFHLGGLIILVFFSISLFLTEKFGDYKRRIFQYRDFKHVLGVFFIIYIYHKE